MNLDRIFLPVFLLITNVIFSQSFSSGIVTYSVKPISLINKKNTKDTSLSTYFEDLDFRMDKLSKFIEYKLKMNEKESIFFLEKILDNEYKNRTSKFFRVGNIYNHISGKKIRQKDIYGSTFLITSNVKSIKWNFLNETKKIGKYTCYKATTKIKVVNALATFERNVNAWYCPNITIPFGPMGYGGLPGLILELTIDKQGVYSLKKIILYPNKGIVIKEPIKGKTVTEKEFNEIGIDIYERRKNGM